MQAQPELVVLPVERVQDVVKAAVRVALAEAKVGVNEDALAMDVLRHKIMLSDKEVQKLYGLKAGTLANMRSQGRGPAFVKDGKIIRYCRKDVEAYLQSRRVKTYEQR